MTRSFIDIAAIVISKIIKTAKKAKTFPFVTDVR